MKRIYNDKIKPYLTLPDGVTITWRGSTLVLNEEILESPKVKELLKDQQIRIEEQPEPERD
jgi:hypothetical protein